MPHSGNINTGIPGPYPPSSMGGHGAVMDIGDVLHAGVSGQLMHYDHDLNFKQPIVTRHAIDPDGAPREIEVTDACWDSQGRLYVPLYGPVGWDNPPGGSLSFPQIQWFDNSAVDLGRFDQNVFFNAPTGFDSLLPYGICCLRDDTFIVLAVETIDPSPTETLVLIHLDASGNEIARWTPDQVFSSGPDQQSVEVGPDGYTVYYCDSQYVRRFDTRTGVNVTPILVSSGPDGEGVVVLPDGGIIVLVLSPTVFRRYRVSGSVVWETSYNSVIEPGDPGNNINIQALGLDQNSFYSYFTGPTALLDPVTGVTTTDRIVHLSLVDGSVLDWQISPAIPYPEGNSWMTVSRVRVRPKQTGFATLIGAT